MLKSDTMQNIYNNLEKVLEDYFEILDILKNTNNDIVSLFFAKRRCLNVIYLIKQTYTHFLNLNKKYHQDNSRDKLINNEEIISLLNEDF